jgi:3-oxoacyl-[acyl-carrier-protein] synthase II
MPNHVVVTGFGAVTPLGLDAASTWSALVAGESGVGPITLFDASGFDVRIAAEVKNFDPSVAMDRKEVRRADRFVQFAVAASREALDCSELTITEANRDQIGVIVGSGIGGLSTLSEQIGVLHERGPRRVSPFLVPMMLADMASGRVSIALGARGPNPSVVSACSSGADSIGYAAELIRRGDCVAMLAGGAEAPISPIGVAGFASEHVLSLRNDDPCGAARPFDATRDGFVIGEGAAMLLLESLEHAEARGARIYAQLSGYAMAADAYHITHPADGGEGGARVMRAALRQAGAGMGEIDYINAHGTSTPMNDRLETQAIKTVFGEHAFRIPISSTKSMLGHMLGAAGALEACVCVQAITHGIIPPTINYTTPDPACDLDYTPNTARQVKVATALTNSFGFGGHNTALVFRAFN